MSVEFVMRHNHEVASIVTAGIRVPWNAEEKYNNFPHAERMGKKRGQGATAPWKSTAPAHEVCGNLKYLIR